MLFEQRDAHGFIITPAEDAPRHVNLPPRAVTARDQYLAACEALNSDSPTDRDAYDLLGRVYGQKGEVNPLPTYATWARYLGEWRTATGQQKRKPRAGHADSLGRSVAPVDQLDGADRPGGR